MTQTLSERVSGQEELYRRIIDSASFEIRVAEPGFAVEDFDPIKQTVKVQLAVRERVIINGVQSWDTLPVLVDVPVRFPRGGGYSITFPIKKGDEGLVVFADMCIDAAWQSGGVQNQIDRRRHDLSDGFFFPGTWSQPNVLGNYATDSVQLRNDGGDAVVEIDSNKKITVSTPNEIDAVVGATVLQVTSSGVAITGTLTVSQTITASGNISSGADIHASGNVSDSIRSQAADRVIYNGHQHEVTDNFPTWTTPPKSTELQ